MATDIVTIVTVQLRIQHHLQIVAGSESSAAFQRLIQRNVQETRQMPFRSGMIGEVESIVVDQQFEIPGE